MAHNNKDRNIKALKRNIDELAYSISMRKIYNE